jgi:hypothetical protein
MIDLLKITFGKLAESGTNIYFEEAPMNATFPYAVFTFPNSIDLETDRQDFTLQVDVWDNNLTDTTRLENATSQIDKTLHKLRFINEQYLLIFQRENRLMIPDPDLKRRQLRYIVKTYER